MQVRFYCAQCGACIQPGNQDWKVQLFNLYFWMKFRLDLDQQILLSIPTLPLVQSLSEKVSGNSKAMER